MERRRQCAARGARSEHDMAFGTDDNSGESYGTRGAASAGGSRKKQLQLKDRLCNMTIIRLPRIPTTNRTSST
jgi:hypothetical protein